VFSTVHANSALESIERLVGLGIKRDLVVSHLLFASAQRLVPKNCPDCRVPDEEGQDLVRAVFDFDLMPQKGQGCASCRHTGSKGRVLLFESLVRRSVTIDGQMLKELVPQGTLRDHAVSYLKTGDIHACDACAFE
jgi:type II secretory ATPase GspE/PulE/Tfp pilus assembly ATPase PilB-like protein